MKEDLLTGDILDEHHELSLRELCRVCSLDTMRIVEFVDEGILKPTGRIQANWRFSAVTIQVVQRTVMLQRDLDINLAGVALVLDLMEEIEQLRSRVEVLDRS